MWRGCEMSKSIPIDDFDKSIIADFIASNWVAFVAYAKHNDVDADEIYKKLGGEA